MNKNKLNILLYTDKSKLSKKGECPIKCRLTYLKIRKQFSTGLFVNPKYWNSKKQKVLEDSEQSDYLNTQLSLIMNKINQAFLLLQIQESNFSVEDIYSTYKGEKLAKEYNVVEYFEMFLKRLKRLINIEIKAVTYKKYNYVKENVKSFIKWKYKRSDYPLKKLKQQFLDDFDYYLKVERGQKQVTINKEIQRFRKPIKVAVSEGYLERDPFMLHKNKKVIKKIVFLTTEELQKFESHVFEQSTLRLVQDLFIFSCYTGLAYNELKQLSKKHIVKGFDGMNWIEMTREKTQGNISVPILSKASDLIVKYRNDEVDQIFPVMSNQQYNSYLKVVGSILGFDKVLTTHIARKTFASTVLLYNDVPIEIVSKLLGHSSISITEESYGKVIKKRVSDEVKRLGSI
ncbi:site-specific integrase [Urechidicola vernalis]|uniref:Site-specific integrase n=1 Tax=Urechidicola vernalis TaxID=3075600 RepID=A0ABU2Y5G2_9FLAO|nr:site-specific integrase [Urechidicola sp. P050]MDT0553415.1 site-specific integrase [Urechidicola sp. P050]